MDTRLFLSVDPVPKPRMTRSDVWKKRPACVRYWDFKDKVKAIYPNELPATFSVVFNVPMPKSWSNKKKMEMHGKPHQQKPDVDNYLKSFMDALCEDDSYVYDVRVRKQWSVLGNIELIVQTKYNDREKE